MNLPPIVQKLVQNHLSRYPADHPSSFSRIVSSFALQYQAVDSMSDGFILVNSDSLIVNVNISAAKMIGMPRNRIIGYPLSRFLNEGLLITHGTSRIVERQVMLQVKGASYEARISPIASETGDQAGYVIVLRDITVQSQIVEELKLSALTDELTGVLNRRAFYTICQSLWNRELQDQHQAAILFIDVDHFKQINDRYGHLTGDKILQAVVERVRCAIRKLDIIARYGGDEFLILVPDTNEEEARQMAQRICSTVAETPFRSTKGPMKITISVGVAGNFGEGLQSFQDLIDQADHALYQSKAAGRNQFAVWQEGQA